jgi:hypothetical protein
LKTEREAMRTDGCGNTSGLEYQTKGSRKQINETVYIDKYK